MSIATPIDKLTSNHAIYTARRNERYENRLLKMRENP